MRPSNQGDPSNMKSPAPAKSYTGKTPEIIKKYMTGSGLRQLVAAALAEDIGPGDATNCIFSANSQGKATLLAKAPGILSGTEIVDAVFRHLSRKSSVRWNVTNGSPFSRGDILAEITGPMRVLLSGERVALNFLQRMCGVATITSRFVNAVKDNPNAPGIYDTRKTTPLLRAIEKHAVVHGGGESHRFALYDMAMLKNNHIDAAGSIEKAVQKLRVAQCKAGAAIGLCVEARTQSEALEATACGADIIMLDNMTPAQIWRTAKAVHNFAGSKQVRIPELEISGGITLKNIAGYAKLPVQRISVGALTHSAPSVDISMRYVKAE